MSELNYARLHRISAYYAEGILDLPGIGHEHESDIEDHIEEAIKMWMTGEGEEETYPPGRRRRE